MAVISTERALELSKSNFKSINWLKSLKTTGNSVRVRFLLRDIDDIHNETVHTLPTTVNGQVWDFKYECLNDGEIDDCPLCKAGIKMESYSVIPMLIDGVVFFWSRGSSFIEQLKALMNGSYKNGLYRYEFTIVRNGLPRAPETTYQIMYEIDTVPMEWEQLPKADEFYPDIVNRKTAEELNYYLKKGEFQQDGVRKDDSNVATTQAVATPRSANPFSNVRREVKD